MKKRYTNILSSTLSSYSPMEDSIVYACEGRLCRM